MLSVLRSNTVARRFTPSVLASVSNVRSYMGGATDGTKQASRPKGLTDQHMADSATRDAAIRTTHKSLPTNDNANLDLRRKRLVYRSKQRGWLEVDLLLGTWASLNVAGLNESDLNDFELLVNTDTIEIYNLLTLRTKIEAGSELDNKLCHGIITWCEGQPLGKATEDYVKLKKDHGMI